MNRAKTQTDNDIKQEEADRAKIKLELANNMEDLKRELNNDETKAKAENQNMVEKYNLAKDKMKDPMFFKQLKNTTIREIYSSLYCSNYRVKSMTGKDPIVQAFESLMTM
jgi:hypothetical protein